MIIAGKIIKSINCRILVKEWDLYVIGGYFFINYFINCSLIELLFNLFVNIKSFEVKIKQERNMIMQITDDLVI
jgi:hypothetical protein